MVLPFNNGMNRLGGFLGGNYVRFLDDGCVHNRLSDFDCISFGSIYFTGNEEEVIYG